MIVQHKLTIRARCPVNGNVDWYDCEVTVTRLVQCEQFVADAAEFSDIPIYQEELTTKLAEKWQATVTTRGTHVDGAVSTKCTAFPKTLVSVNTTGMHG